MALLNWDKSLSVNIKQIDEEHKVWIGLINTLHDAMKLGQGRAALNKIIDEVVNYTYFHFESEEKLFKQHGFPETGSHKKIHDDFVIEIKKMKESLGTEHSVSAIRVMEQLKSWLTNHIMVHDKKYGVYLNSKGVY